MARYTLLHRQVNKPFVKTDRSGKLTNWVKLME